MRYQLCHGFLLYQVVTKPFVVNAMVSFIGLLKFPLPSLKSFVQILQMHMVSTHIYLPSTSLSTRENYFPLSFSILY